MLSYFFFFKQKTAYEMRISDWSSDVCSSDLADEFWAAFGAPEDPSDALGVPAGTEIGEFNMGLSILSGLFDDSVTQVAAGCAEIGRESCRERVCQYV